jgi:hypothetical protein
VDPLSPSYPWYTPYQFAGNKPIEFIELEGLEEGENKGLTQYKDGGRTLQLNYLSPSVQIDPNGQKTFFGQKLCLDIQKTVIELFSPARKISFKRVKRK